MAVAATPTPEVTATPTPTATPGDGLPGARCPTVPASVASTTRAWVPTAYDTCSAAIHDRYSVVGPDGKRYPTWHPPTYHGPGDRPHVHVRPRARRRPDDVRHRRPGSPSTSRPPATRRSPGCRSGSPPRRSNAYADGHPGTAKRSEDHVGYKVDIADDVRLLGADGGALGVTCDYLTVVHQGSHSRRRALQQRARAALRDPLRRRHRAGLDHAQPLRRRGRVHPLLRAGDPHPDDRQRLPGRPGRAADPRPRVRRAQRARPRRPDDVRVGAVREVDVREHAHDRGRRHDRPLRRELGRLQPEPLRERQRHDRPHAPAVLGDRGRRRQGGRRRLLGRQRPRRSRPSTTRSHRSTAPAATSTSRARRSRTPAAGSSTGPTRTAATPHRRRSPAPSASSSRPPRNRRTRRSRCSAATAPTTPRGPRPELSTLSAWRGGGVRRRS